MGKQTKPDSANLKLESSEHSIDNDGVRPAENKLKLKNILKIEEFGAMVGGHNYMIEYEGDIYAKWKTDQLIEHYPKEFAYYLEERCENILTQRSEKPVKL